MRVGLSILAVTLLSFTGAVSAQSLDQVSKDLAIKAQRTASAVNFNFSQAELWLRKGNPQKAREVLRESKQLLEDDVSLPNRQRVDLLDRVNARLVAISSQVTAEKKAAETAAQQAEDNAAKQQKKLNDDKRAIQNGPAKVAAGRLESAKDVLAAYNQVKANRERGVLGILNSGMDFDVPENGVITLSPNWDRITKMREQKLHPKEIALLKALNSTLSVDFKGTPFNEVIEYLQEKTGQAIIIDENSLKDAMIESNDPVTFKVNKVTVRTILKKVLADRGLSYIIKEGMIQVMSAQRAREHMVIRSYPVSDLVGADPMFYGPFTPLVIQKNAIELINLITNAIEPSQWQVNGGPGTITFHPPTMSLVVRASAEMHYMFGGTGLLGR